jgi:hypothetical protein
MQHRLAPPTDERVGEVAEEVAFMIALAYAAAQTACKCGGDEAVEHRHFQHGAQRSVRHDMPQARVLLRREFLRGVGAAQGQPQRHCLKRKAAPPGHQPRGVLEQLPPVEPAQCNSDDQQGEQDSAHGRTGSRRGDKATVS